QRLQDLARGGSLHRDQGVPAARVDGDRVEAGRYAAGNPRMVLLDVRGVDDEQEMVVREPVDEQIVDEGALRRGERGILRLADLQLRDVVAGQVLERRERVAPGHLDLAHVADIEEACPGANGQVLVRDAAVLDGHFPPAERHHPGAKGEMAGVERRSAQGGRFNRGHECRQRRGENTLRYYAVRARSRLPAAGLLLCAGPPAGTGARWRVGGATPVSGRGAGPDS